MKKFSIKILNCTSVFYLFMMNGISNAADIGDPTKIGDAVELAKPVVVEAIKPISAILIFLAVIIIGINIILKRNKADERMGLMTSLMTIAIASGIIGFAGLIYSFIMSIV